MPKPAVDKKMKAKSDKLRKEVAEVKKAALAAAKAASGQTATTRKGKAAGNREIDGLRKELAQVKKILAKASKASKAKANPGIFDKLADKVRALETRIDKATAVKLAGKQDDLKKRGAAELAALKQKVSAKKADAKKAGVKNPAVSDKAEMREIKKQLRELAKEMSKLRLIVVDSQGVLAKTRRKLKKDASKKNSTRRGVANVSEGAAFASAMARIKDEIDARKAATPAIKEKIKQALVSAGLSDLWQSHFDDSFLSPEGVLGELEYALKQRQSRVTNVKGKAKSRLVDVEIPALIALTQTHRSEYLPQYGAGDLALQRYSRLSGEEQQKADAEIDAYLLTGTPEAPVDPVQYALSSGWPLGVISQRATGLAWGQAEQKIHWVDDDVHGSGYVGGKRTARSSPRGVSNPGKKNPTAKKFWRVADRRTGKVLGRVDATCADEARMMVTRKWGDVPDEAIQIKRVGKKGEADLTTLTKHMETAAAKGRAAAKGAKNPKGAKAPSKTGQMTLDEATTKFATLDPIELAWRVAQKSAELQVGAAKAVGRGIKAAASKVVDRVKGKKATKGKKPTKGKQGKRAAKGKQNPVIGTAVKPNEARVGMIVSVLSEQFKNFAPSWRIVKVSAIAVSVAMASPSGAWQKGPGKLYQFKWDGQSFSRKGGAAYASTIVHADPDYYKKSAEDSTFSKNPPAGSYPRSQLKLPAGVPVGEDLTPAKAKQVRKGLGLDKGKRAAKNPGKVGKKPYKTPVSRKKAAQVRSAAPTKSLTAGLKGDMAPVGKTFQKVRAIFVKVFPMTATVGLSVDASIHDSDRHFAMTGFVLSGKGKGKSKKAMIVRVAPELARESAQVIYGVLAHEFGHAAVELGLVRKVRTPGYDPIERQADAIAEKVTGDRIYYDSRGVEVAGPGAKGIAPRPDGLR